MSRGELNSRSFKPWRADRRYLDSYRKDMRDCDDLMVQQQVHLDPRAVERVAPLLDRPVTRTLADTPSLPERSPDAYRSALETAGHEVIVVDITSPDVASTGHGGGAGDRAGHGSATRPPPSRSSATAGYRTSP